MKQQAPSETLIHAKLLGAMLDGFVLSDPEGVILDANPAYCSTMGYSRDELLGMHVEQLLGDRDNSALKHRIRQVLDLGSARFETTHVAKQGQRIDFEISLCKLEREGVPHVAAFLRDITERKVADQKLQNTSLLLDRIQPAAHLGIWQWDIRANVVSWSDELYRIYGLKEKEFGASFEAYLARVHPDDRVRVQGEVLAALESVVPFSFEERVVRPSGEVRSLRSWGGVVRDEQGQPLRMFGACLDITETVATQAALRAANEALEARVQERTAQLAEAKERAESSDRLKSSFLATMSHELRTPLNSILGFTGVLLKRLAGPITAEQEKQLGMVRDSGQLLLALINDVLDLSKIEADALTLSRTEFSLCSSVQRVVEAQKLAAEQRGLAFICEGSAQPISIHADKRRIEQILTNLISNAIKFTSTGSVRLSCGTIDGNIYVRVTDTGIGIAREHLPVLFLPFRQIDHGLARRREGTGLGLSISQHLARMHQGEIRVESELGVGSTFSLVLPKE